MADAASAAAVIGCVSVWVARTDEEEDLHLRGSRERIPLRRRGAGRRDLGVRYAVAVQRPRPVDAVGLDAEADEGGHRDAAVLDLGLAEEANRGLLAHRELRGAERHQPAVSAGDWVCFCLLRGGATGRRT